QSAHRDPRLRKLSARLARERHSAVCGRARDPRGGRTGRRPNAAAPRLQPQADDRASGDQPQRTGARPGGTPGSLDRRGHRGRGTGRRRATVYGIVDPGGGGLRLYSEPGIGATVKLYLPRAVEARTERAARPEPAATALPPPGTGAGLLVEDESAVRTLVERM